MDKKVINIKGQRMIPYWDDTNMADLEQMETTQLYKEMVHEAAQQGDVFTLDREERTKWDDRKEVILRSEVGLINMDLYRDMPRRRPEGFQQGDMREIMDHVDVEFETFVSDVMRAVESVVDDLSRREKRDLRGKIEQKKYRIRGRLKSVLEQKAIKEWIRPSAF